MKKLHGTGVALVTPFYENGDIDFVGLKKLLQHTAKGVDYFVVLGTTGETSTLTDDEKASVLSFVKHNNIKNFPIVYGVGGNNTQEILNTIKETDFEGVSAVLSVSPYYNKPSQEGIYQHYKTLAAKCPVPIILYNVPGRTGSNITASTTLRLATIKNIIGIKEASGNLEQCMQILAQKPKDFMVISGDDLLTLPLYSLGAIGVISVLANVLPQHFKKIRQFALLGNYQKAQNELFSLLEINGLMYEEGNPTGIKHALQVLNICGNQVRLPLVSASKPLQKKIEDCFQR